MVCKQFQRFQHSQVFCKKQRNAIVAMP